MLKSKLTNLKVQDESPEPSEEDILVKSAAPLNKRDRKLLD
jgi:hypothetical protein